MEIYFSLELTMGLNNKICMDMSVMSRELRIIKPKFLKLLLVIFVKRLLKEGLQSKTTRDRTGN